MKMVRGFLGVVLFLILACLTVKVFPSFPKLQVVEVDKVLKYSSDRTNFWEIATAHVGQTVALAGNAYGEAWVLTSSGRTVHTMDGVVTTKKGGPGPQFFLQKKDGRIGLASAKNGIYLTNQKGQYLVKR